jgi:Zn-dependent protease
MINIIFYILVLIFSIIIHEISHGIAADWLGDPTARMEGRITLNPIPHIDPIGSVVLPLLLVFTHSPFLVGWAKPVPFNPYNFRQTPFVRRFGESLVAIAGPVSNLIIALVAGIAFRILFNGNLAGEATLTIISTIVLVNLVLAVFNLIPVPPLDGSKILFSFFPYSWRNIRNRIESYAIILSLIVILFAWQFIAPVAVFLYNLITGLH